MARDPADHLRRVVAALPGGGEAREGQLDMARAIAAALERGRHLVVQAGTGTGKSLAYLVPAILWGKPVVVATATKALQDQLAEKDLPFLQRTLGRRFEFAVLKGRSNYLCMQRAREVVGGGDQQRLDDAGGGGSRMWEEVKGLLSWAERSETGDRAELPAEPSPRIWSMLSVSAQECPGAGRCPAGSECFSERARRRAAEADVVVVNMHLYGAHLASGGMVLPEHEAVVFDEAHELEDVLAESLGAELGPGRLRVLAASARTALAVAGAGAGAEAVADLFDAADRLEKELAPHPGRRLRSLAAPAAAAAAAGAPAAAAGADAGGLAGTLALLGGRLQRVEAELRSAAREAKGDAGSRCTRAQLAVEGCRADVQAVLQSGPDEVVWVEGGERSLRLRIAPIDVAPVVAASVFDQRPVVMTTATAPPGLGRRLGAEPDQLDELDVGSPFPYADNALLYCAAHLPDRRRVGEEAAEAALHAELEALVEAAGGRTMALFTSWRAMRRAVEVLRARLRYPVLSQEDLPKPALVDQFKKDPTSCLFATMSFWQGVDVPGATCSLVVIDRLPFPRPDDPVMSARRDLAGAAAFRTVDLPRAAMLLAQGAGRLIRSATDKGVVAVLDPRLATARSYRWELLAALPPMRRTRHRGEAEAFLRGLRDEEAGDAATG